MDEEDFDPIDSFLAFVVYFVESYTDFHSVKKMNPETYEKFITKIVLLITFETSPRKNYDILMATIREWVTDILERRLSADESAES